jgi:hypothetical protein
MRELHSNPESESGSSADDVLFAQFVNFGDADISDNDG